MSPALGSALDRNGVSGATSSTVIERKQNRRDGDGSESAKRIKRGADWSPERKGGEHRHPDPSNDPSCVRGTGEGKPPAHRARDDEALRSAEQRPAAEQDRGG